MPQKKTVERICQVCGKKFYSRKHDIKCGRGLYCSWKCSGESKKKRIKRECIYCGKSFEITESIKSLGYGKFCSRECHLNSYRNPVKTCVDCGVIIDNRATRCVNCAYLKTNPMLGKNHTKETRERLSKWRKHSKSPKTSGKNHWNWKGGKGSERNRERAQIPYKKWRESVFERDNYTCQKCLLRSGSGLGTAVWLEAHHIKPYSKYPLLRYEVSNGVTLCKKCHVGVHSKCQKQKQKF